EAFDAIVAALRALENDETLLIQSGKPVGVFRTHTWSPRVLIANANLVGRWATWDCFSELERAGLTMYGQMTAGSWIYIGSQGILQGTYETFGAVARTHFGGSLVGRFVLTAGLGGMGGAQPPAGTRARRTRSPRTSGRCSPCSSGARSPSTTATTFGPSRRITVSKMRSRYQDSCRSTCARCSVKGRVLSAGWRSPAIRTISRAPTSW